MLAVIIAIAIGRSHAPPPALTASCTKPAFALSSYDVKRGSEVRWSMTGRPGLVYELTIGIERIDTRDGKLQAVPEQRAGDHTVLASKQVRMDRDCLADSAFGVAVDAGRYTVRMFELRGPQSSPSATQVATRTLVVTGG